MKKIPCLMQAECLDTARKVLKLEDYMMRRDGFYTLGASHALDGKNYPAMANAFNVVMGETFERTYHHISSIFSDMYGKLNVGRTIGMGFPGFHIFDDGVNGRRIMNHGALWPVPQVSKIPERFTDATDQFSFTLPIMLPKSGSGVEFWWGETDTHPHHWYEEVKGEYTSYELGQLYVHDGKSPNRIMQRGNIDPGEFCITLQGHGVILPEGIVLYY